VEFFLLFKIFEHNLFFLSTIQKFYKEDYECSDSFINKIFFELSRIYIALIISA